MATRASRTERRKRRRPSLMNALGLVIRTRVTAGLITVLPILATIWLLRVVFEVVRDSSLWLVEAYMVKIGKDQLADWGFDFARYKDSHDFLASLPPNIQWIIAGFSVLLTIALLYTVGLFTANLLGRRMIHRVEKFVDQVPIVKTIYRSIQQILATFTGDQTKNFQRVALIPFPQERMRCVGFITSIFKDSLTGEELATVFIPTTPNPTTGYLQILRRKELVELDWSVEDAMRTIMSGGILKPDYLTIVPTKDADQYDAVLPPPLRDDRDEDDDDDDDKHDD